MDSTTAAIIAIAATGGMISGMIGATKNPRSPGVAFIGFFMLGFLLPVIGIVAAVLAKGPTAPPQPPGWYPDPWQQAEQRYYDGSQWTYHMA